MQSQPSILFARHSQQQPFTLTFEREAWHILFDGHRVELDIPGSRVEVQVLARCYWSLFLRPGAPFGGADLDKCTKLDMAEREAAIELEVQQRRLQALLYAPGGDGTLGFPRVVESSVRYRAGEASSNRHIWVVMEEETGDGTTRVAFDSRDWRDPARFQQDLLGVLASVLQQTGHPSSSQVYESSARYSHGADRGDGRDDRGRFVADGQAARDCGRAGFEMVVYEILPARYPDAVNAVGVHMAFNFMGWLRD